jgi:hypothetical protein
MMALIPIPEQPIPSFGRTRWSTSSTQADTGTSTPEGFKLLGEFSERGVRSSVAMRYLLQGRESR